MTEFEVILVPLSVILGLGATAILAGLVRIFRARRSITIDWVPIVCAFSILLYVVGYFHVLYDIDSKNDAWTLSLFASTVFQTALLYFSAAMILPSEPSARSDLASDFDDDGKWALAPLAILFLFAPLTNWLQQPGHRFLWDDGLNLTCAVLLACFFVTKRLIVVRTITVVFAILTLVGWTFFWSAPGRY